ncbi:MAG: N-carbamoyl-D-amino-acid hydrolase [Alphaproteobacteria bacterium]|nr:N-carbamoyl-D-amino-acid hydrolase [Alphaproteobacteria bacterium]
MSRMVTIGAAQVGPIARNDSRQAVVARLVALMEQAAKRGCDLVVFPELTLTTFFPRWFMTDQDEIDQFFEREMPSPATRPLFDAARRLGLGFYLGYAELEQADGKTHRYNTTVLVDKSGAIVGKYRKIHLPGHAEHEPWRAFQHLEKRYFEVGNLGFRVWRAFGGHVGMCICNDRRWPETYRVMGLQDVELVLIGYNTPYHNPPAPSHDRLANFHNHLVMQSGAYQNATWVVGVAKAGREEGCDLIGESCIIAPTGEIVTQARTLDDELIVARCDLDEAKSYKATTFNFGLHRQPQAYRMIVDRMGAEPPRG